MVVWAVELCVGGWSEWTLLYAQDEWHWHGWELMVSPKVLVVLLKVMKRSVARAKC